MGRLQDLKAIKERLHLFPAPLTQDADNIKYKVLYYVRKHCIPYNWETHYDHASGRLEIDGKVSVYITPLESYADAKVSLTVDPRDFEKALAEIAEFITKVKAHERAEFRRREGMPKETHGLENLLTSSVPGGLK
jgi:hypothetical protein